MKEVGILAYLNWRLMLIVHICCWGNLILNPPQTDRSRLLKVYHWSCSECIDDRFDFRNYGIQIIGTVLDIIAHSLGFIFMFKKLDFQMQMTSFGVLAVSLLYFFLVDSRFKTHKHMMPKFIKKVI